MLRLIHKQTIAGPVIVDDIDDGLPNKLTHRLGSTADPKAYKRDGYANEPKQPSYVPRTQLYPTPNPTIRGFIDLNETPRVTLSAGKGKIFKLQQAGLIDVVSFVASDLATPVVTNAVLNPGVDLTITGTKFLSLTPDESTIILSGHPAYITQAALLLAGGTISDIQIVIPFAILPMGFVAGDGAQVLADNNLSNVFVVV